ncbi:MAG: glycerophosphodiester phosphodiesterase family protein [Parvularculaceae bacterium]
MRPFLRPAIFLALAALASCTAKTPASESPAKTAETGGWSINPEGSLNDFFNCLADTEATLVAAHRGGAAAGYPEDSLETMQKTLKAAPALMEIDIATSSDGVLYLNHDDTLDRETTGSGLVNALPWSKISNLYRKDIYGAQSPFHPTRLSDALQWAKGRTILELDFKKSTRFEDVIAEVNRQHAEGRVILIAYTLAQAKKLHRLAPDMMISLQLLAPSDLDDAIAAGIPADRIIAFTGIEEPKPDLYAAFENDDVEIIFGTLGGRDSIDKKILASGYWAYYADLSDMGVDLIATDLPVQVNKALEDDDRAVKSGECGVFRASAP